MTEDWVSVKGKEPSAEDVAKALDLSHDAYMFGHAARELSDVALHRSKVTEDKVAVLEAEAHGLRARVKLLEDLVDIADRTAMWGCLLAAVSAGIAVGAVILAVIAEAIRCPSSSATGAGTPSP